MIFLMAGNIQCLLEMIPITPSLQTLISVFEPGLSLILVTLVPEIMTFGFQLFLELRTFDLNENKLEIDYHISNLMMKRDFGWDNEDLYWTLQIEIPGIVLYIREFYAKYQ